VSKNAKKQEFKALQISKAYLPELCMDIKPELGSYPGPIELPEWSLNILRIKKIRKCENKQFSGTILVFKFIHPPPHPPKKKKKKKKLHQETHLHLLAYHTHLCHLPPFLKLETMVLFP
jgi:hypothetical protein